MERDVQVTFMDVFGQNMDLVQNRGPWTPCKWTGSMDTSCLKKALKVDMINPQKRFGGVYNRYLQLLR